MKLRRATTVASAAAAMCLAMVTTASPASAVSWEKPFDTDGIGRSTPSNNAYTTGSFTWQWQDSSAANRDQRAAFNARLHLQGSRNSCARLQIRTYVGSKLMNSGATLEKAFPSSGYYTYCQADGRGYVNLSGADIQDRSITDIGTFKKATVRVCWTRNKTTPPGGDCYGFTIHPGD